jgi:hypothetical protein
MQLAMDSLGRAFHLQLAGRTCYLPNLKVMIENSNSQKITRVLAAN